MEKFKADPKHDIATEKYQGPGRVITSAGYMYISHGLAVVGGFLGLGAIGLMLPGKTNAIKYWAENLSQAGSEVGVLKRSAATVIGAFSRTAESLAEKVFTAGKKLTGSAIGKHIVGNRLNGKSVNEDRAAAGIFAAGFGAVFGYIGSTIWGLVKGHSHGDKGKRQFIRAQEEIKELRDRNDDLNAINDKLHEDIRKVQLRAKEINAKDSANEALADTPTLSVDAAQAQHEGKLEQREAEAALA